MKLLSRQEEIVLLSIQRLREDASGVSIREFISGVTGKYWSIGSIYVPLDRLIEKGYVDYFFKDTANRRGGRRKRFYRVSPAGMKILEEALELQTSLWKGFPDFAAEDR